MKIYLDCYPCLLYQPWNAVRRAGASENLQHRIFMLQAKDNVIARDLGITDGGTVLKQQDINSFNK